MTNRRCRARMSADYQPQPSSCNRSSSMPKWWAISWITVIATSSTTSLVGFADLQQRVAVDRDGVRQRPGVVGVAFGQRHPFVQSRAVRRRRGGGRQPARRRCPWQRPARAGSGRARRRPVRRTVADPSARPPGLLPLARGSAGGGGGAAGRGFGRRGRRCRCVQRRARSAGGSPAVWRRDLLVAPASPGPARRVPGAASQPAVCCGRC